MSKTKELTNQSDGSFFTVNEWMVSNLKLTGNELLVYALIYSFTKDGTAEFHGSSDYIAKRTGITQRTALSTLKNLTDRELIIKTKKGRYCNYSVSMKILHTSSMKDFHIIYENSSQESMKNLHNNYENSSYHIKSSKKEYIKSSSKEAAAALFNSCNELGYNFDDKTILSLCSEVEPEWLTGKYPYQEFITEETKNRNPEKSTGLFLHLFKAEDMKAAYKEWCNEKEAEEVKREKHRLEEAAELEKQQRLNIARTSETTCLNCRKTFIPDGDRGSCSCGWEYYFDEDDEGYKFHEPLNFKDAWEQVIQSTNKNKEGEKVA